MEFFRIKNDIPFMKYAIVFNVISLLTFFVAVAALWGYGLNFSVEFRGGTLVELHYPQSVDLDTIRTSIAEEGFEDYVVQHFGSTRDVLIRLNNVEGEQPQNVAARVHRILALTTPEVSLQRSEFVGPQVGKELAENGALALLIVICGIVIYLALRFEWRFAVATIIANLHDVIIILGFFAIFQWEFSLPVLAAILAVLGYSVNESVVVFDRVREVFRNTRNMETKAVIDHAITRTISRTIITHGSTQIMVLAMLIFGGEALYYFSLALTVGILFGIYSSVLVASPLAMWLGISREQLLQKPKERASGGDDGACV